MKTNFTIEQLDELAAKVRGELGIAESNFIDVTELAEDMGFEVFEADFDEDSIQGTMVVTEGEKTIYVDEDLSEVEKRYIIALQIAKVILNQNELYKEGQFPVDYKSMFAGCVEAADYGLKTQVAILGAALLMPKRLVEDIWGKVKSVEVVAQQFKVPVKSALIRLDNLGLI